MDYKKLQSFSKDWNKGPFGIAYNASFLNLVIDTLTRNDDILIHHYGVLIDWLKENDKDDDDFEGLSCLVSMLIANENIEGIVYLFDNIYNDK